jgi:hypothetical protein
MTDQTAHQPAMCAVSRDFAASVYVSEGSPTARDLCHWLSMMTPGLVTDPETAINDLYAPFVREAHVAHRPMELIHEARVDRMARLRPMHGRLMGTRMGLIGSKREEDVVHEAFLGWGLLDVQVKKERVGLQPGEAKVHVTAHGPKALGDLVGCRFPSRLIAEAHIAHDENRKPHRRDPVCFDLAAMGAFKNRYSPILLLRCLAWLAGGTHLFGTWKRVETTHGVAITIPMEDLGKALGAPWLKTKTQVDDLVFKSLPGSQRRTKKDDKKPEQAPGIIGELRGAGIDLHPIWQTVRGYSRVHTGLTLQISRIAPDKKPRPRLQPAVTARPVRPRRKGAFEPPY